MHLLRNLHFEVHKALHLLRRPRIKIHLGQPCQCVSQQEHFQRRRGFRSMLAPNCENQPRVQMFTIHCTCYEIRAHQRPAPCPKCSACHEICTSKSNVSNLLHLPQKVGNLPMQISRLNSTALMILHLVHPISPQIPWFLSISLPKPTGMLLLRITPLSPSVSIFTFHFNMPARRQCRIQCSVKWGICSL